jgi:hypothetical protein
LITGRRRCLWSSTLSTNMSARAVASSGQKLRGGQRTRASSPRLCQRRSQTPASAARGGRDTRVGRPWAAGHAPGPTRRGGASAAAAGPWRGPGWRRHCRQSAFGSAQESGRKSR